MIPVLRIGVRVEEAKVMSRPASQPDQIRSPPSRRTCMHQSMSPSLTEADGLTRANWQLLQLSAVSRKSRCTRVCPATMALVCVKPTGMEMSSCRKLVVGDGCLNRRYETIRQLIT